MTPFRYVRELKSDRDAVLEFELELDAIKVNGVDLIKWNDAGLIVEFKVMIRPLKAINLIHQKMGQRLRPNPLEARNHLVEAVFAAHGCDSWVSATSSCHWRKPVELGPQNHAFKPPTGGDRLARWHGLNW